HYSSRSSSDSCALASICFLLPATPSHAISTLSLHDALPISSSFSRLAQVTAKLFFPAPNANPATNGGNNLRVTGAFPLTSNQQTYRLDQSLGRWGTIFGRGTYATYKNASFNGTVSQPEGYLFFEETAKSWMVSHTITLGGSTVNNFRFGFLRAIANEGATAPPDSAIAALGLTGTFTKFTAGQTSWP